MPLSDLEPLLLSVNDVCQLLRIGRTAFFSLRSCGKFPLKEVQLCNKLLYKRVEIEAWVQAGCPNQKSWGEIMGETICR
jgi:predicted DNA-binding transcriptional regulator AlpA